MIIGKMVSLALYKKFLNQVPQGFDAFVLPVDHLPIKRSTYSSLIDSRVERFSVIQPSRQGENGHPVLLSERFIQEILNCDSINNRLDYLIHELPLKYKIQKKLWILPVIRISIYPLVLVKELVSKYV